MHVDDINKKYLASFRYHVGFLKNEIMTDAEKSLQKPDKGSLTFPYLFCRLNIFDQTHNWSIVMPCMSMV